MMHKKIYYLLFALCLVLLTAGGTLAQQNLHPVSGVVMDADEGVPLSDVTVLAPDAGAETRTNAKGRFSLSVPADSQVGLVFRKQGYRPVTKKIDGSTSAVIVSMKKEH